jgi:hypothetical protein
MGVGATASLRHCLKARYGARLSGGTAGLYTFVLLSYHNACITIVAIVPVPEGYLRSAACKSRIESSTLASLTTT